MNNSRLLGLINKLLALEKRYKVQSNFEQLKQAFASLVGEPQNVQFQTDLSQKLDQISASIRGLYGELTPAELDNLTRINAADFFHPDLIIDIKEKISENSITPAIAQKHIEAKFNKRQSYINTLESTGRNLKELGVRATELESGESEIGFLIPRSLFDDELENLAKELKVINRIFKIVSESIHREPSAVKVRSISTTDPIFFFAADVATIAVIAGSVTWLLGTLKQILEIRNLRTKARDVGLNERELKVFDDRIERSVNKAIEERVGQILQGGTGRQNELRNGLDWVLRSMMARIERGMIIEVRAVPPPKPTDEEEPHPEAASFDELDQAARELEFPAIGGQPVIGIPGPEPEEKAAKAPRRSKAAAADDKQAS